MSLRRQKLIYLRSEAGRGSWLFTHAGQPSKLRHYWAESVFSQLIPGVKAVGLEFAVGSVRYPAERGEGFGFAESSSSNTFSKGLAAFDDCMGDVFPSVLREHGCKVTAARSEFPSTLADGRGLQSIPMVLGLILSNGCSGPCTAPCRRKRLTALKYCSLHKPGTL